MDTRFPALADLRKRAQKRMPHFVWEYLDSGTGSEATVARNRAALDAIILRPAILKGEVETNLQTSLFGQTYSAPFGMAPVGMSGMMWPNAERTLADIAAAQDIPFCMSNVATRTPEDMAPHIGSMGWFQLYAPRDADIRNDMLKRIWDAGFHTLVFTVDVPVASRRERQRRGGLTHPPRLTPRILAHMMARPAWAWGSLRHGMPRLRFIESYSDHRGPLPSTAHIGYLLRTSPDWHYIDALRKDWPGNLVIKGVQNPDDATRLVDAGADGIWISNHAGRQFDAGPAASDCIPAIRASLGPDIPIIYDSGIETGLDILRAMALGADFAMLGRGFHYGLGAFGKRGAQHVIHILREDMICNMGQMGIRTPQDVREFRA